MRVIADLCIVPIGVGVSVSKEVGIHHMNTQRPDEGLASLMSDG